MKRITIIGSFILTFVVSTLLFSSCSVPATTLKKDVYKNLYEERPLAILVMPPINKSTKVEAKELFYSSLCVPFAQKGYYVMPPLLTLEILKEESAYDAEMFINNSMKRVGELFGVDAVLFTTIEEWQKTTIANQVRVRIEYMLKSAKTDEILFNRVGDVTLDMSTNSGNVFADILGGMLATALQKEITVGRKCNFYTIEDIPGGKYSPKHNVDGNEGAGAREFVTIIKG